MDVAAFLAVLAATLAFGAWLIVHEEDDPDYFTYRTPLDSSARAARDPGAADDAGRAATSPGPARPAPSELPGARTSQPAQRAPGPHGT